MQLKADGNAAYAAGDFVRAAAAYSRALEADVEGCLRPHLLANRAQARMHEERFAEALADCDAALALDAHSVKLLLRRAACHVALHDPNRARYDYAAALKLEPTCQLASDFLRRHDAMRRAKERAEQPAGGGYGYGPGGSAESDELDEFDAYELLGVARDANAKVIKDAYRKLALKWHPDKHADADEAERARIEDEFRKVCLANLVLSDPVKRRQYDVGGRMKDITK
jgi:DnaJ-domain-containing protein 1